MVGVEENPELKQIFLIIIKIGNYLNQGTNKGNSISFNPELLKNLKAAKAVGDHHKSTMLDFILDSILKKQPELLIFIQKLEACQDACKIDLATIQDALGNFIKQ